MMADLNITKVTSGTTDASSASGTHYYYPFVDPGQRSPYDPFDPYKTVPLPLPTQWPRVGTGTISNLSATYAYHTVYIDNNKLLYEIDALHVKKEDVTVDLIDGKTIHVQAARDLSTTLIEPKTISRANTGRFPKIDVRINLNENTTVLGATLENGVIKILVRFETPSSSKISIKVS